MNKLICVLLLITGCSAGFNNKLENNLTRDGKSGNTNNNDTVICILPVHESTEKEYFLIIHNDTSSFSLFINSNSKGNIVAKLKKDAIRISLRDYLADSSAVVEDVKKSKKSYNYDYDQSFRELQILLNSAADDYELKRLEAILVPMSVIPGFAENITRQYNKLYGEKINSNSIYEVAAIVKNSEYITKLNLALFRHKIKINEVFFEELDYYKQSKNTLELLDGVVVLITKQID